MSSLSIIIPTLNEAGNIARLLNLIFSVTRDHNFGTEVIVVDDGSQDGTRETVADLSSQLPVTLICRNDRQGLASAVVEGAHAAQNDLVIVMDGDFSHSPHYIPQLVTPLLDGAFDIAIGSRYTPAGSTPDWPLKRKVFSKLASFPAQILTGIDDPLSGFFAVSRERLVAVNPNVAGYKICLELLLGKRDNMKIIEIPICFRDRQFGASKMSTSVIKSYFGQLARLCNMPIPSGFCTIFVTLIVIGFVTELIITNTGSVISPLDLPNIFDQFYRVDKSHSSRVGGFGLGLTIVRKIVELHGGTISASSTDVDTSIHVCLPIRQVKTE